jgi:hypothetical protein
MTEAEWGAAVDPQAMLRVLRGRGSDRKLRLFAAACCRLVWDDLPFEECRVAVQLGERYADGLATAAELGSAARALNRLIAPERGCHARLAQAASRLLRPRFSRVNADWVAAMARTGRGKGVLAARQCDVVRDVIGTPLRRVVVSVSDRSRKAGVLGLAQGIYDRRAFDRLPALGDALADAGCDSADVLAHCRVPGVHTRGCWVIDCLLERG